MNQDKTKYGLSIYRNADTRITEIGIDEAGRGCLFGPVTVAAVIWPHEDPDPTLEIKDSKKVGEKKRMILKLKLKHVRR